MPTYEVETAEGPLEVWYNIWNGRERVTLNGAVVSEEKNLWLPVTTHRFEVASDAGPVHYELDNAEPMGHVLRRDGTAVATKYSRLGGFLVSLGLIYAPFAILGWLLPYLGAPAAAAELVEEAGLWLGFVAAITSPWWLRRWLGAKELTG